MSFFKYCGQVLYVACTHTFHASHTIIMVVIFVAGTFTLFVPKFRNGIDINDAELTVTIVVAIFSIRLFLAPYWISKKQNDEIDSQRAQLDRISEDRPLTYVNLNLSVTGNNFHSRPTFTIARMELNFENVGDRMIRYKITELFFEREDKKTVVPLGAEAVAFVHARQSMSYGFDVTGFSVQKFPVVIIVGFKLNYDNVPAVRARGMRRVIENKFLSFVPMKWSNIIREQEEY